MKLNCKNYEQIEEIAEENDLETRELTSGSNGYPENLRLCITGFDTYEQAKDLADKYGGKVTSIRRRDGWQSSESKGTVYAAYDIHGLLLKDYPDDNIEILYNDRISAKEYLANMKDIFKEEIDDAEDFDTIRNLTEAMNKACDIADKAEELEDDELLFVHNGYTEVMKKYDTHYSYYAWTYDIAVEFPK